MTFLSDYDSKLFSRFMRETQVVLLAGAKRAGKDTVASMICQRTNAHHVKLAHPMKKFAKNQFGFTHRQLEEDQKEVVDPYWKMTPRQFLQQLGTEAMQPVFGKEVWCKALALKMYSKWVRSGQRHWVVSDVRFDHEINFFMQFGLCSIIRVRREVAEDAAKADSHKSEHGIRWHDMTGFHQLHNNASVTNLQHEVNLLFKANNFFL